MSPFRSSAAPRGFPRRIMFDFWDTPCRSSTAIRFWEEFSTGRGSPSTAVPNPGRRRDRHRRPLLQSGQPHHPEADDPDQHPDDRCLQLPGGEPEAAYLLHSRASPTTSSWPGWECRPRRTSSFWEAWGSSSTTITFFRRTFEESGVMNRVIMFIHLASDPVVECLLVPDMALAVAERFAEAGKRVLVLLTDMTNFSDSTEGDLHLHGADPLQPRLSRRPLLPARVPL